MWIQWISELKCERDVVSSSGKCSSAVSIQRQWCACAHSSIDTRHEYTRTETYEFICFLLLSYKNRFKTAEFRLVVHAHTDAHVSVIVIYAANDGEEFKMIKKLAGRKPTVNTTHSSECAQKCLFLSWTIRWKILCRIFTPFFVASNTFYSLCLAIVLRSKFIRASFASFHWVLDFGLEATNNSDEMVAAIRQRITASKHMLNRS